MFDKDELKKGLTENQVGENRKKFGANILAKKVKKTLWQMFLDSLKDIWIKILIGALLLKVALAILGAIVPDLKSDSDLIEIISIAVAIGLSAGFSTISEYRNTSRSEALQEEYSKTFSSVVRDGKLVVIPTADIVLNDIVLIQSGNKVPADGIVIDGNIFVSQAALNGESRDEEKIAAVNLDEALSTDYSSKHKVFMGSVVTVGEAYMVVTVIGDDTELGKINKSLTQSDDDARIDTSSLKLKKVALGIGKIGIITAVLAGVIQIVLKLFIRNSVELTPVNIIFEIAETVMLIASIIIMAVPEGLPMMNSLVQSMNTESMYKKHILVSHKAAFSDSAYMNILFTDKTGTVTYGNLSLVEFINGKGEIVKEIKNDDFINSIALNNLAKVSEGHAIGSNNMDRALLNYALSVGFKASAQDYDKLSCVSGFNSEKKCAEAELKNGVKYWKGATEVIIDRITHYMSDSGNIEVFSNENKECVLKTIKEQAERTMKMLSVAKNDGDKIILLAVLCLRDNVREDAVDTVKVLNNSGIQVVMVTGDGQETAKAIAKEAGIFKDEESDVILTHEELEKMSDDELKNIMGRLRVVSRAKPLDKKRLVMISQSLENVCGMTGDGVNDAPALKQADIGFAMGDGTAVAQEAGDVVILNNSLTSIKDCVLNSRTMAKSVGKFLIFQLTVNIVTLLMNIIVPILGWSEPFSIVQILWINLIMDTLAAMAFGGEPVLDRYMREKPVKRTDNILTGFIKSSVGVSALFITLGAVFILENVTGLTHYLMPVAADPELFEKSFMFAFFIYSVIFNSLNTRSEYYNLFEYISQNKRFIFVMGSILIAQTLIIEFGTAIFGGMRLDIRTLAVALALALLIIPVDLIRKAIYHKIKGKKQLKH